MSYTIDRVNQLKESIKQSRFGSVASLRRSGTPSGQHNVKTTKKSATKKSAPKQPIAKKTAAKKAVAKKTAKKAASKKS